MTNLYRDEILDEALLPIYHVAYTACFRREQISAGRDVRGIKRGYQFDKVEMVKFVHPETLGGGAPAADRGRGGRLRALELPYRVVQLCTGDLGFAAADKYRPRGVGAGLGRSGWKCRRAATSRTSRRGGRTSASGRPRAGDRSFVHTLNGSGLALPRTMIAIMEKYQQADGTIDVPMVLRPYMGGQGGHRPATADRSGAGIVVSMGEHGSDPMRACRGDACVARWLQANSVIEPTSTRVSARHKRDVSLRRTMQRLENTSSSNRYVIPPLADFTLM